MSDWSNLFLNWLDWFDESYLPACPGPAWLPPGISHMNYVLLETPSGQWLWGREGGREGGREVGREEGRLGGRERGMERGR